MKVTSQDSNGINYQNLSSTDSTRSMPGQQQMVLIFDKTCEHDTKKAGQCLSLTVGVRFGSIRINMFNKHVNSCLTCETSLSQPNSFN